MYERKYTLRYGDLDRFGNAKIGTIFDILQDISTLHSAHVGFDIKTLYSLKMAFLLKGWRVKIHKPLNYDSDITVLTGIMKIRHFETIRKYELWQDGVLKIEGTGNWMPVNIETKKILVCPDEIKYAYDCITETDNDIPFVRVREDTDVEAVNTYSIQRRDIDTNGHVNNVKSIEIALEAVSDEFVCKEIQVTYVKEIRQNERIGVFRKIDESGCHVELKDTDGKTCVLVYVKK